MFSTWDLVRPRFWHPMASLEQSMMDLDHLTDHMLMSRFPFDVDTRMLAVPNQHDEEDFFHDLPVRGRHEEPETTHNPSNREGARAFSSYSFSDSTIVDDKGRRVTSTRRRYEDSTGRLKAVHERKIGDKKVRSVWQRSNKEDEGKHEQFCLKGDLDEFEKEWKETAFGVAEDTKKKEAIKETAEAEAKQKTEPQPQA
ncbi:hypothetical protein PINS_up000679 [Pythium insidiosum]|nr:hypothetical protein PINS_up000679 [Pythium insidiosum]